MQTSAWTMHDKQVKQHEAENLPLIDQIFGYSRSRDAELRKQEYSEPSKAHQVRIAAYFGAIRRYDRDFDNKSIDVLACV